MPGSDYAPQTKNSKLHLPSNPEGWKEYVQCSFRCPFFVLPFLCPFLPIFLPMSFPSFLCCNPSHPRTYQRPEEEVGQQVAEHGGAVEGEEAEHRREVVVGDEELLVHRLDVCNSARRHRGSAGSWSVHVVKNRETKETEHCVRMC